MQTPQHPLLQMFNTQPGTPYMGINPLSHLRSVPPPPPVGHNNIPSLDRPSGLPYESRTFVHRGRGGYPYDHMMCPPARKGPQHNYSRGSPNFHRGGRGGRGHGNRGVCSNTTSHRNTQIEKFDTTCKMKPTCETCDRAFPGDAELAAHIAEHETCHVEGCKFTAHPKVLAKHVLMQHQSGLFSRITVSSDPEEVARWIQERKRRYPSKMNIQKKVETRRELDLRGERLQEPRGRFAQRKNWNRGGRWQQNQREICPPNKNLFAGRDDRVKPLTVTQVVKPNPSIPVAAPVLPSALASLVANYGSSDSEPEEAPTVVEAAAKSAEQSDDSDSAPEEVATLKRMEKFDPEPLLEDKPLCVGPRKVENAQRPTSREQYFTRHRPPTLLEKTYDKDRGNQGQQQSLYEEIEKVVRGIEFSHKTTLQKLI